MIRTAAVTRSELAMTAPLDLQFKATA